MKSTIVEPDGTVRCPVCKGTSFTLKRTAKAKVLGVATIGVGALAMPKRVYCMGCGANLKPGSPPATKPAAAAPARPQRTSVSLGPGWKQVMSADLRKGDEVYSETFRQVVRVAFVEPGRWVHLDDGRKLPGDGPWKARRPQP